MPMSAGLRGSSGLAACQFPPEQRPQPLSLGEEACRGRGGTWARGSMHVYVCVCVREREVGWGGTLL
jgi:hypothetical protein